MTWSSDRIRDAFVGFFAARGHVVRPSASLIPVDPTLLLTNAGMVQFKPYFLGQETPPWPRAVSVQKCVRTVDIDIIGTTKRHLSFFEMLGNFSFGDYFKETAIPYGYEFCTEVLGLDPDRMWYTVHETDDEAAQIWVDSVGVPPGRVQRGGKDNFWQMGVPGPCGPSSEIFWDRGPQHGPDGGPIGGGEDRFVEIWNLVFMQNIQDEPYQVVGDLPAKNIDTGMGLDRVAAVLQDVDSVFEIDTTGHVLSAAERETGLRFGEDMAGDVSLRILADHARSVTFLIGDGVIPSNLGRGHVLRRVLRRAVRHAWQHGGDKLVVPALVEATIEVMGDAYPGLVEKSGLILDVATREEERFRRTLESGHQLLDTELSEGGGTLSGATAFRLHDTYGFPIELTTEIASERGIEVDMEGFEAEMAVQRERARAAWRGAASAQTEANYLRLADTQGLTDFLGYEEERARGRVLALVMEDEMVEKAEEGQLLELFLDRTPFYAESGGQVGDIGVIETETGLLQVFDTRHAIQGLHGHRGRVERGMLRVGQTATAVIDGSRREAVRKSHTGTHVLHWALRDVLGEHAGQAGSLVEAGRLRFDFSNPGPVSEAELAEVEAEANRRLIANHQVTTVVTTKEEATAMGALAFFGDKYGDTVRVVKVGDFSTEFCGGTHTMTSAQVGPLIVLGESSIGSNLRRVEALTGVAAYDHIVELRRSLDAAGRLLQTNVHEVPGRLEQLLSKIEGLEAQLGTIDEERRRGLVAELASRALTVGEVSLVVAESTETDPTGLRQVALGVRERVGPPVVVVLGAVGQGKGALIAAVSKDLVERGVSAADLISAGAAVLGGGSSRDPELAQAGGPQGSLLPEALELAREGAERALGPL
ncbi:MAG: alanine--tRNA ligase [Actinobacteria bacterium]|nr:alanine--tRNA ligase [Actinomycetota bacterium]